jgi:glutamate racemase
VPLIEAGEHNSNAARMILQDYLKPLLGRKIDTLILGCTHYGILERSIRKIAGDNVKIISESDVVAKKLKIYLGHHPEIEKRLARRGKRSFYSTDLTEKFQKLGSKFFGKKIKAQKADLK